MFIDGLTIEKWAEIIEQTKSCNGKHKWICVVQEEVNKKYKVFLTEDFKNSDQKIRRLNLKEIFDISDTLLLSEKTMDSSRGYGYNLFFRVQEIVSKHINGGLALVMLPNPDINGLQVGNEIKEELQFLETKNAQFHAVFSQIQVMCDNFEKKNKIYSLWEKCIIWFQNMFCGTISARTERRLKIEILEKGSILQMGAFGVLSQFIIINEQDIRRLQAPLLNIKDILIKELPDNLKDEVNDRAIRYVRNFRK